MPSQLSPSSNPALPLCTCPMIPQTCSSTLYLPNDTPNSALPLCTCPMIPQTCSSTLYLPTDTPNPALPLCTCPMIPQTLLFHSVPAQAGVGPLFSLGISGPRPAHFFHGSGNWINEATVQLLLSCSFLLINTMVKQIMRSAERRV